MGCVSVPILPASAGTEFSGLLGPVFTIVFLPAGAWPCSEHTGDLEPCLPDAVPGSQHIRKFGLAEMGARLRLEKLGNTPYFGPSKTLAAGEYVSIGAPVGRSSVNRMA